MVILRAEEFPQHFLIIPQAQHQNHKRTRTCANTRSSLCPDPTEVRSYARLEARPVLLATHDVESDEQAPTAWRKSIACDLSAPTYECLKCSSMLLAAHHVACNGPLTLKMFVNSKVPEVDRVIQRGAPPAIQWVGVRFAMLDQILHNLNETL